MWRYFEFRLGVFLRHQNEWFKQILFLWTYGGNFLPGLFPLLRFLPIAISWGIWRVRNEVLYDNRLPSSSQAIFWAEEILYSISAAVPLKLYGQAVTLARALRLRVIPIRRRVLVLHWEKPSLGCWKLNTDGSSLLNPGESGCGFVLRNADGIVMFAE